MLSNRKNFSMLIGCAVLFIAGLACNFSFGGEPSVGEITTCKSVTTDQVCEGQSSEFKATETVFASVAVENLSAGDEVTARWLTEGEEVLQYTFPVEEDFSGNLAFSLMPEEKLLPPGQFTTEISYNTEVVQTANFEVAGAAPEEMVQNVTLCRAIDDEQQCQDSTTTFDPTDTVYASLELSGVPAGTEFGFRWLQGDELITEVSTTLDSRGSGFLAPNLTPDQPFPPDEYSLEISIDGTVVEQVSFDVEGAVEAAPAPESSAGDTLAQSIGADGEWQTLDSDAWQVIIDYPAAWQIEEQDSYVAFLGEGKTQFYLTGITTDAPADEATLTATEEALALYVDSFPDFEASDIEPFAVGGEPGLTSDYIFTDNDGDLMAGSIIVVTSASGNTYTIYIEALAQDYEAALEPFNGMLASLRFK